MQFKNLAQFLVVAIGITGMTFAVGCSKSSNPPPEGATLTFVVDVMDIGREDPPGVAPGFDLDNKISDDADPAGCFQPDFISPDGVAGIDNQFAVLAPTIEGAAGTNLADSIADSVASGSILIMPILDDVNDNVNDPSVNLTLLLGEVPGGGAPTLTAAGAPEPGQTFDINPNSYDATGTPLIYVPMASLVDGHIQAGPVDIVLALPVSGNTLTLTIRRAQLAFDLAADGSTLTNGVLGGELVIEELITAITELSSSLPIDLVRNALQSSADLAPNAAGDCDSISIALTLHAVSAIKGVVATPMDGGTSVDAGISTDAGPADAGPGDAGPGDAGPVDSGAADAGPADAGAAG